MATASIGIRLREARKKQHLTQSKLAKDVGISVSYLNLIEHNKRAIGGALLNRLASKLDLDVSKLSGQE
ncbi:MAG: helix-turn-helix transcriptional regulator, partial [Pseudomonadota bacterium]